MFDAFDDEPVYTEERIGPYSLWLEIAEDDFNPEKKTLFATMIWHGARALSNYLVSDVSDSIVGQTVIEFGAGAGLPSLICHKIGASIITASDYPAPTVIANLLRNVQKNMMNGDLPSCESSGQSSSWRGAHADGCEKRTDPMVDTDSNFHVIEHTWGEDVTSLLQPLSGDLYDIVIASECLWKSDTHRDFVTSISNVLKPGGTVYLSFSHHIPGNESTDLLFFDIMKRLDFVVKNIKEVSVQHMWSDRSAVVYIYELQKCPRAN